MSAALIISDTHFADGLLRLIAEKLPGKRLVFLAGNHDHGGPRLPRA